MTQEELVKLIRLLAADPQKEQVAMELLQAADLIEAQAREIERLKALLKDCADDLAAEIDVRYISIKQHAAMKPRYEREMAIVYAACQALGEG